MLYVQQTTVLVIYKLNELSLFIKEVYIFYCQLWKTYIFILNSKVVKKKIFTKTKKRNSLSFQGKLGFIVF